MKLKSQRLVSQGSLNRMLQAANEAWKRCDFQQAIEVMERAHRLDPANFLIILDLGRMHGSRFNYTAAESCFERAVRVAPKKSEALAMAGQRCRDFGNSEMAGNYFRRSLEQKDASPETLIKLGEMYERLHRLDDAAGVVERALQMNGDCPSALLARARLDRQAGRLDDAERLLRSLASKGETPLRVSVWYELGGLLDKLGRYDEAMAAFLEAKALLWPDAGTVANELRIIRARVKELVANTSAEVLRRWSDNQAALEPQHRLTLLCGHPRSGTTLLEQVLDSHPAIVSAEETTIFHDDAYMPLTRGFPDDAPMFQILESATTAALQQSRANYFQVTDKFLGKAVGSRLLIDKNPSYTFLIAPFIRIFPEISFLVALRDPRDVCLSCFMQNLPLNQAASAFLSLGGTVEEYAALMDVWRTLSPTMQNPRLEVRYEDLVDDLESAARRVLEFLGVAWDTQVLRFDEHARGKLVRSPTYADVKKPVFKTAVGRWRNYQKYLGPHLEKLEPYAKAFGYE